MTAAKLDASNSFTITGTSASVDPAQTYPANVLKLRNLSIAAGGTRVISIDVTTPCTTGNYTWGIQAKQSPDFTGTGDFTLKTTGNNLITSVSPGCRLAWVTQPANAAVGKVITDSAFADIVGPTVHNVQVKVENVSGSTVTSVNSGTVMLNQTSPGSPSGGFTYTPPTFVAGVATFVDLKGSVTGTGFKLQASSAIAGVDSSPDSGPFNLSLNGVACTTSCAVPSTPLDGNKQVVASASSTSGNSFTFLAIDTFNLPDTLPAGCTNFKRLGSGGFQATDGRTSGEGTLKFTYSIPKTAIAPTGHHDDDYDLGIIPLCAGGALLDSSGAAAPCTDPEDTRGWLGRELRADGNFSWKVKRAVCDPSTGLFWGILGSFLDKYRIIPSNRIDPSKNPIITGWSSTATDRIFYISVPFPWDWKMG